MASGTVFLKMDPMNLDCRGMEGEHTWVIKNLFPIRNTYATPFTLGSTPSDVAATSASAPQGVFAWKKNYGTYVLYYATDTNIYEMGVGSRASGLTAPDYGVKFAPYGPTLFATNGVDPIQLTTGGAFSAITIPTNTGPNSNETCADIRPKFLIPFKNQLIAANITVPSAGGGRPGPGTAGLAAGTYRHLVWWSSPDDAQAFGSTLGTPSISNTDFLPIFDESIEITGLAAGEDGFFVFKEHGIYRFDGPPFNGYQPITMNIGCVAPRSITRLGEQIFFISQYGLTSINTRTNELKFHSDNANRETFSTFDFGLSAPLELDAFGEDDVTLHLTMAGGRSTLTMAADSENGLLFLAWAAAGDYGEWKFACYNVEMETWTLLSLAGDDPDVLLGNRFYLGSEPLTTTNGGPLGKVLVGVRDASNEHAIYRYDTSPASGRLPSDHTVYVRWPYLFSFPDKRVSIRRIRPVFIEESYDGVNAYEIEARIYSRQLLGIRGVLTESTDQSKDLSINIPDCPFAEAHSIGLWMKGVDAFQLRISSFLGVEVEYEEDLYKAM